MLEPRHAIACWMLLVVAAVAGAPALSSEAASPRSRPGAVTPQRSGQRSPMPWTMADLLASVTDLGSGHDWQQGRALFERAACGGCHAFGRESEGTGLAPDLTSVASKYTRDFILQSILEPSATLSGQYFHTTFTLKNGEVITGSIVDVIDGKIVVAPVMLALGATIEIAEADVKSEQPSPISPMPAGLLDGFTQAEVVALMAFLDSGGDPNATVYRKR